MADIDKGLPNTRTKLEIPSEEELEDYYYKNYSRQDYDSPITRKRYNEILDKLEL